jgi:hypothetical protein
LYAAVEVLQKANARLVSLNQQRETLEEAFLRIVQNAPAVLPVEKAA